MSCTFYILDTRLSITQQFATFLDSIFPGMNWASNASEELAETLAGLAESQSEVFVIYREDLPADVSLPENLVDVFGADVGDLVVELPSSKEEGVFPKFWRVEEAEYEDSDDDAEDETEDKIAA